MAVNELTNLRSADQSVETPYSFIKSVASLGLRHPVLIGKLGAILDGNNRELVKEAVTAVARIGPEAAAVKPALQRIAESKADKELSSAAAAALSRLDKK